MPSTGIGLDHTSDRPASFDLILVGYETWPFGYPPNKDIRPAGAARVAFRGVGVGCSSNPVFRKAFILKILPGATNEAIHQSPFGVLLGQKKKTHIFRFCLIFSLP